MYAQIGQVFPVDQVQGHYPIAGIGVCVASGHGFEGGQGIGVQLELNRGVVAAEVFDIAEALLQRQGLAAQGLLVGQEIRLVAGDDDMRHILVQPGEQEILFPRWFGRQVEQGVELALPSLLIEILPGAADQLEAAAEQVIELCDQVSADTAGLPAGVDKIEGRPAVHCADPYPRVLLEPLPLFRSQFQCRAIAAGEQGIEIEAVLLHAGVVALAQLAEIDRAGVAEQGDQRFDVAAPGDRHAARKQQPFLGEIEAGQVVGQQDQALGAVEYMTADIQIQQAVADALEGGRVPVDAADGDGFRVDARRRRGAQGLARLQGEGILVAPDDVDVGMLLQRGQQLRPGLVAIAGIADLRHQFDIVAGLNQGVQGLQPPLVGQLVLVAGEGEDAEALRALAPCLVDQAGGQSQAGFAVVGQNAADPLRVLGAGLQAGVVEAGIDQQRRHARVLGAAQDLLADALEVEEQDAVDALLQGFVDLFEHAGLLGLSAGRSGSMDLQGDFEILGRGAGEFRQPCPEGRVFGNEQGDALCFGGQGGKGLQQQAQ